MHRVDILYGESGWSSVTEQWNDKTPHLISFGATPEHQAFVRNTVETLTNDKNYSLKSSLNRVTFHRPPDAS